jgi:hypothetical protein
MRKTPSSVVMKNCNEYLAYENLGRAPIAASGTHGGEAPRTGAETDPKDIKAAFALMSRAIGLLEDEDRTVDSSLLKQKMIQLSPTFDEKTFGFGQFKAFLAEAQKEKIIHIGKREGGVYPISLGRIGKKLEDEEPETAPAPKPAPQKRVRKRRR